jgi:putative serine protease PepD
MLRYAFPTVEPDDELDDDSPAPGWVDPDDRLWRHPSEVNETPWPASLAASPLLGVPARREPRLWTVAALAGLVGALLASGVLMATGQLRRHNTIINRPLEQVVLPASSFTGASTIVTAANTGGSVVAITERTRPAIVELLTDGDNGPGSGSGVLLRSDGHIVTNLHVVDNAARITAVLANGRHYKARVVGSDADTDLAVVKIDADTPLTVATIGTATSLKAGQQAVAIGSPLGLAGGPSVSVGVVSALGRELTTHDGHKLLDMIQTDAPIAPGSSGGALLDGNGAVIGITTALAIGETGNQGLGFATPIDIAKDTANQLITTGKVVHVWVGVEGEDVDAATAGQLGLAGGAMVKVVAPGSPAAVAGIEAGDLVVAVDDRVITSMAGLVVALRSHHPGDRVSIGYLRDGRPRSVKVKLAARPQSP